MKQERELIQGESSAAAEQGGQGEHRVVPGAKRDDRRPRRQSRDDSGHQMMEMDASQRAAAPAARAAEARVRPRRGKGQEKREQEEEERLASRVVDVVLVAGN